ncbi:hypothetical protein P43SY_000458 [Pythium insidiosum]|uniref:HECT-type E3 ubiquitin transferase n=1 Tax=Pythium insidiosum TaxID=114742 RepID=A0AAD5Q9L7_PYTIN|nr:hypothetical protein P43SY_000458 [Pythium insidiosum]
MSSDEQMMIGVMGAIVLAMFIAQLYQRRQTRLWARLHAPLHPDSTDIRLDLALRQAQAGSIICDGCGFENFQDKIFCSMCGQALTTLKKKQMRALGTEVVLGNKQRQDRVRQRKEWTRKFDVEGRLYWYQSGTLPTGPSLPLQHSVIRFQRRNEATNQQLDEAPGDISAVALSLEQEHDLHEQRLEAPAESVPLVWLSHPLGNNFVTPEIRELILFAQRDFPTRLADFITRTSCLSAAPSAEIPAPRLKVHRTTVAAQSIEAVALMSQEQARGPLRIDFDGEHGIDAGGVYREWCLLVNEYLSQPSSGVFTCVNASDHSLFLNANSKHVIGEHHLAHVFAAGRLVGRSLLEGNVTGFHLSLPLLKTVLGMPIGLNDLAYYDPELHRSLVWLLENETVDALALDFSVCEQDEHGNCTVVDLIPGGRDVLVTDDNKAEYVQRKLQYVLFERVSSQLFAFLKGIYDIVPCELLMLFDAEELDFVLSGSDEIDVDDWERHTRYSQDMWHHPTRQWFWEILREMSNDYRRRLLQFATGSSRVPLAGFSALTSYDGRLCPFTITKGMLLEDIEELFVGSSSSAASGAKYVETDTPSQQKDVV